MSSIHFEALPTPAVRAVQAGAADAYGMPPEIHVSDGDGVPCRHCLKPVAKGKPYLILAWRPFPAIQPYAETGPIFLHAEPCERAAPAPDRPAILTAPDYIVRGYSADHRIVYGSGAVTATAEIPAHAAALLGDPAIAYLHVRSARNNCYQCAVVRG